MILDASPFQKVKLSLPGYTEKNYYVIEVPCAKIELTKDYTLTTVFRIYMQAGKRFLVFAAQQAITSAEALHVLVLLSLFVINSAENKVSPVIHSLYISQLIHVLRRICASGTFVGARRHRCFGGDACSG